MPSSQILKRRIRSVNSTKQITRAMQLVSASKMRRAQDSMKSSSYYTESAKLLLQSMSEHNSVARHPLFEARETRNRLYILIASDKGMAGSYNSNILKFYLMHRRKDEEKNIKSSTIAIGSRASRFVSRLKDTDLLGVYDNLPDKPSGLILRSIISSAYDNYLNYTFDSVDLIYTEFISSIIQKPVLLSVLPAGISETKNKQNKADSLYEPSLNEVLDTLVYRLIGAQIFQAFLDARASEHSMRMLAMKNATDNASDLIDDLTLEMNKARQASITQELAEISGGVEAISEK